ncbi:FKBP12-associated protein [Tulasnella sp. 332]|nr:FKBP12-associated protein [Tulasnella sp. 332]
MSDARSPAIKLAVGQNVASIWIADSTLVIVHAILENVDRHVVKRVASPVNPAVTHVLCHAMLPARARKLLHAQHQSATAASTKRVLPCMPECAIAKRNEKLAAALGIDPGRAHGGPNATVQEVKYSEGLISFSKVNSTFLNTAEKALHEFITSDKRMIILPPMPLPRRQFIRGLAEVYRLDGEDVDQEPRRSVQLRRRIDSRIPPTLLSTVIRPPPIASATANSSTTPVKMAWGQKPPPPSNAAAAIAARPSPSNHSAWTAVPARPMSTGPSLGGNVPSRPITPQAGLSGPTGHGAGVPIPMPIARTSSAEEDVPDSWDEIPDS